MLTTLFQTTVNIIGRKLPMDDLSELDEEQARLLSKITDRQLLSNLLGNIQAPAPAPVPTSPLLGLLGGGSTGNVDLASLLGGSTVGGDVVNQIAMQVRRRMIGSAVQYNKLYVGGAAASGAVHKQWSSRSSTD